MLGRKVNPIPELVKGSKTPYRCSTSQLEPVVPFGRKLAFEGRIGALYGPDTRARAWYALGSGRHWVGVLAFRPEALDNTVYSCVLVLQSGKNWSTAENRIIRWMKAGPTEKPNQETGSGSPGFLRWAAFEFQEFVAIRQASAERGYPSEIAVAWADETRRRAYRWLTRLGFREGESALGEPAYVRTFFVPDAPVPRWNPIRVELHEAGRRRPAGAHERSMWSRKAAEIIEQKGAKIRYDIKYAVSQDPYMPLAERGGEPGVLTLLADPGVVQAFADYRAAAAKTRKEFKVSLYTIHTILHRLGDEIMPDLYLSDGCWPPPVALSRFIEKNIAVPVRMEQTWDTLYAATKKIKEALRGSDLNLSSWLPLVVDTRACREGWIKEMNQALAELVPMHLLYSGIRFRPTPARWVPDAAQRARVDAAAVAAIPAFGAYIDGMIQVLQGCRIRI